MSSPPGDLFTLGAVEIAHGIRSRQWSLRELAAAFIKRSQELAPRYNAYLAFSPAQISLEVDRVATLLKQQTSSPGALPLAGVPIVIKDNICTRDLPTTCGSQILNHYQPPYDATVVARLRQAGALIFAKSNLDEFGMGSSNENSAYGPVRNPWDGTRVAGGSSGGSAAAVAAGLAPLALGSDTGGSIRQPASFCGIAGFKPSYGQVSRFGLAAYASSLDHIGPLARRVEDLSLAFHAIAGMDPYDATSSVRAQGGRPPPTLEAWQEAWQGKRVGVIKEFADSKGLAPGTAASLQEALKTIAGLGAEVVEVSLPALAQGVAAYYMIAMAEASSNLARYDGVRYGQRAGAEGQGLAAMYGQSRRQGLGREVRERLIVGTFVLSAGYGEQYYERALAVRQSLRRQVAAAFAGGLTALVGPTTPTPAFRLGEHSTDPVAMFLNDSCTTLANLAGLPSLSLPCGFDGDLGLPLGWQILTAEHQDHALLLLGHAYQQVTSWHLKEAPLPGKDAYDTQA